MRILSVLHSDLEPLGAIEAWTKEHGYTLTKKKPFLGDSLCPSEEFDFLIIMGGPQSTLEIELYPFLQQEVDFIRSAIDQNCPTLGVCLGAQLISQALGTKPEPSPHKEIGVYPITLTEEGQNDPIFKGFPDEFAAIHWHSDMPGLNGSTKELATSQGCPRQVLRFKDNVYGFQCHFEMELHHIEKMLVYFANDYTPGLYTQEKEEFLGTNFPEINNCITLILNNFREIIR